MMGGQSLAAGEKKDLTFRSNAAFSDFIRVELDGKTLDEKNYTASQRRQYDCNLKG